MHGFIFPCNQTADIGPSSKRTSSHVQPNSESITFFKLYFPHSLFFITLSFYHFKFIVFLFYYAYPLHWLVSFYSILCFLFHFLFHTNENVIFFLTCRMFQYLPLRVTQKHFEYGAILQSANSIFIVFQQTFPGIYVHAFQKFCCVT